MKVLATAVVVRIINKKGIPVHRDHYTFQKSKHLTQFMIAVEKFFPSAEVYEINIRDSAPLDPKAVKEKGQLWCPYCACHRFFPLDSFRGYDRCEICGISTNDFHVKTENKMWPSVRDIANAMHSSGKKKKTNERR